MTKISADCGLRNARRHGVGISMSCPCQNCTGVAWSDVLDSPLDLKYRQYWANWPISALLTMEGYAFSFPAKLTLHLNSGA